VLDIGDWATAVFKQRPGKAVVESLSFAIDPWNATRVEAGLQAHGADRWRDGIKESERNGGE